METAPHHLDGENLGGQSQRHTSGGSCGHDACPPSPFFPAQTLNLHSWGPTSKGETLITSSCAVGLPPTTPARPGS